MKHGSAHVKNLAIKCYPELEAKPDGVEDDVFVELTEYDIRAANTARDPLAVIERYRLEVHLSLASL